jgi:hypothetical protein
MPSADSNINIGTPELKSSKSKHYTDIQSIAVVVYTQTAIINGFISCRSTQRLLDAMNTGNICKEGKHVSPNFIQISDLDISTPDIPTKHLETVFVHKKNIMFIGEHLNTNYPSQQVNPNFRKKKPILTVINLGKQTFTGHMHVEMWEELRTAINTNEQFLPMTDIELEPALADGCNKLGFAAINREHIVYIGH